MRWLFEARLVNDAFGDPGLYVDFRDERRALLFDLGDISVLPPRKLMRLSHVFVTHTHMDHFSGFDHLLRVVLGRKAKVVLFGGPDFAEQVEDKLRAYTWNVTNRRCGPAFLSKVFSWTRILSVRRARPVRSCAGWRPAVPFFTPLRRTRGSADRGGASRVVRYAGADGRKP